MNAGYFIIVRAGTEQEARDAIAMLDAHGAAVVHDGRLRFSALGRFKPPTYTTAGRDALTNVEAGEIVFNSTTQSLQRFDGGGWVTL